MKRGRCFLLAIILITPALGQYYSAEELLLNVEISNSLVVDPDSSDYRLKHVAVHLSFYPQEDYRQEIENINTEPRPDKDGDEYVFEWDEPDELQLDFSVDSVVRTYGTLPRINRKVAFPISGLSDEYRQYIVETPVIDYTDKRIMNLASDLAYGEDDLYRMVHKLGSWTYHNIEYDLNTITADASQKASWVIENRQGVCDEITSLFIGLCRALGIPARFVTGISYTDSAQFTEKWSPHGWAEVYFPGYGWIPFDVTYGELGYIDAAHVKLKDSDDSNKSSTRYEWEGYKVGLNTGSLKINTEVLDTVGRLEPLLDIDADFLKKETGFGSYNAVVVEVSNPHSYYVPTELQVSRSEGLEFYDDHNRLILLGPNEVVREYWLVKLLPGQNRNYIYNYTVRAQTSRNASGLAHFGSSSQHKVYSRDEIEGLLEALNEEAEKELSESVSLECSADTVYYVKQTAEVNCELYNDGNVVLKDLEVCMDSCSKINLSIGQRRNILFRKVLETDGEQDITITAKNRQVTKAASVRFSVWNRPDVLIDELIYPAGVKLSEGFTIEFRVSPKTSSVPHDVVITLSTDTFSKEWQLEQLDNKRKYILNVEPYALSDMVNDFKIFVNYDDQLGRKFSTKEEFSIDVVDVTAKERAVLLLNKLNAQLKYDIVVLIVAIFVAGLVVGLVFRTKRRR